MTEIPNYGYRWLMRYDDIKQIIQRELNRHPNGLTWAELNSRIKLPYKNLCPEWTLQLESEIGLVRKPGKGRAYIWQLSKKGKSHA